MSAFGNQFSDADYHAYADGVMAPQRRSEIIAFLAAHPAETQKVLGWQRQNAFLRAAFPAGVATHPAAPLREQANSPDPGSAASGKLVDMEPGLRGRRVRHVPERAADSTGAIAQPTQRHGHAGGKGDAPRRKIGGAMIAAAGMCLAGITVVLAGLHFATLSPDSNRKIMPGQPRLAGEAAVNFADGLMRRAVEAHGVFAEDREAPVEFEGQATTQLLPYLSRRTGAGVLAPNLMAQGLHLLGGRLLPLQDGVAAMLVYEGTGGTRAALTVARISASGDAGLQFHYMENGATHAVRWTAGDEVYVLTSQSAQAEMLALARHMAAGVEAARAQPVAAP